MSLAGDIGGTSCRLCAVDGQGRIQSRHTYVSREHEGFSEIVLDFVAQSGGLYRGACFGLPGPVVGRRCELTNLPWIVDAGELEERSGISRVDLLNDLQAWAYGIDILGPEDLVTLTPGLTGASGSRGVIAPGTGLGESALLELGGRTFAAASEGGHADIGPINDLEYGFVRYLFRDYRAATYKLVVSGPGLCRLYDYLIESGQTTGCVGTADSGVAQKMQDSAKDRAVAISAAALEGACPACVRALDLWVGFLAAEAANLALKFLALGGFYLGGGIVPEILPALQAPRFLDRFTSRDKMQGLLETVPIHVIVNNGAGLYGAASFARWRQT